MTAPPPGTAPPGWYPSPWDARQLRWWDGYIWTPATSPYPTALVSAVDPRTELADEATAARRARLALVGVAVFQIGVALVFALTVQPFLHDIRHAIDEANAGSTAPPQFHTPASLWLAQPLGLGSLLLQLFFMLWAQRAASIAAHTGLPARHSPGWAIGGFFVPVVNLWFPYQSVVDTLPPDHPHRRAVGVWWTWWLLQGLAVIVVVIAGLASTAAAFVAVAGYAVVPIMAAVAGRRVVTLVTTTHHELLGAQVPT